MVKLATEVKRLQKESQSLREAAAQTDLERAELVLRQSKERAAQTKHVRRRALCRDAAPVVAPHAFRSRLASPFPFLFPSHRHESSCDGKRPRQRTRMSATRAR